MGSILTIANVDFSANAIAYNTPNVRGLTGFFLLGVNSALSCRNFGPSGTPSAVSGSPTFNSNYAAGSFGNKLITPIADSASETVILAVRMPAQPTSGATGINYFGSLNGAGNTIESTNASLNIEARGFYVPSGGGTQVSKLAATTLSAVGAWNMVALVQDGAAATLRMFNLSTGGDSGATGTGAQIFPSVNTKWIGSSPAVTSSSFAAESDVAFAELHNVALTLSECQAVYAAMKGPLVNRGIALV